MADVWDSLEADYGGGGSAGGSDVWDSLEADYGTPKQEPQSGALDFLTGLATGPLKAGAAVADVLSYPAQKALDWYQGQEGPGFSSILQQETLPAISEMTGLDFTSDTKARKFGEFLSPMSGVSKAARATDLTLKGLRNQALTGLGAFAGSEVAENVAPNSKAAQVLFPLVGGMGTGYSPRVLAKIADIAADTGQMLQNRALGFGKADFGRSARGSAGKMRAEALRGEAPTSRLEDSLGRVQDELPLMDKLSPDSTYNAVVQQVDEAGEELANVLKSADEARTVAQVEIVPRFERTKQYIQSLNATAKEKKDLLDEAKEFWNKNASEETRAALKEVGEEAYDGSLQALQRQKQKLAKGQYLDSGKGKESLHRAIADDMRVAIEETVDNLSGLSKQQKGIVKKLNQTQADRYGMLPKLGEVVAKDADASALGGWRSLIRTSGGIGMPLLYSAISGNPLPAMIAGGAALLGTRGGRVLTGGALKQPARLSRSLGLGEVTPNWAMLARDSTLGGLGDDAQSVSTPPGQLPTEPLKELAPSKVNQSPYSIIPPQSETRLPQPGKSPVSLNPSKTDQSQLSDTAIANIGQFGSEHDQGLLEQSVIDKVRNLGMSEAEAKAATNEEVRSGKIQLEGGGSSASPQVAKYAPAVARASKRFNVPEELVMAMIKVESSGKKDAVSSKGASGLMQVMPDTGTEQAKKIGLGKFDAFDPEENVLVGTSYIRDLLDKYQKNLQHALMAYNWGMGNVDDWLAGKKKSVPSETQKYTQRVLGLLA